MVKTTDDSCSSFASRQIDTKKLQLDKPIVVKTITKSVSLEKSEY